MTDVSITARKAGNVHNIPVEIGNTYFDAKFDTGAGVTVISASVFCDNWSEDMAKKLETFCKERGCHIEEFNSASGHVIKGYPVVVRDIVIDATRFQEFHYFFIVNGTRVVALLGDDFIENCRYHHEPHGDIQITGFDFEYYAAQKNNPVDNGTLLEFLDEIGEE